MNQFIDRSYFILEINIPNTESDVVGKLLDGYILKYEKEFLQRLLGITMYTELVAADLTDTVNNQKWIDLVYGKNYTYTERDYSYYGLAPKYKSSDLYKASPIANYIYYWFMRGNATQTSSIGEVKAGSENAVMANPGHKMERAWNEMSKWERGFRHYVNAYPTVYTMPYNWSYYFRPINEFNI